MHHQKAENITPGTHSSESQVYCTTIGNDGYIRESEGEGEGECHGFATYASGPA